MDGAAPDPKDATRIVREAAQDIDSAACGGLLAAHQDG